VVLVDTHCHLNTPESYPDLDDVLCRARNAGVAAFVVVGIDEEHTPLALRIAEEHHDVLAVVGMHPNSASSFDETQHECFFEWIRHPRVVAIGETGLDLYRDRTSLEDQMSALEWHLCQADETGLPLVFHCRNAYDELLGALETRGTAMRGVLHCFSGTMQHAERALALGLHLGFDGPVTYKNAQLTREIVCMCPADRMLLETDCPYLPPEPHRGKRNEPAYLPLIAAAVASARGETAEQVARQTTRNAEALFGIRVAG
jgi:TatD DNase family protein